MVRVAGVLIVVALGCFISAWRMNANFVGGAFVGASLTAAQVDALAATFQNYCSKIGDL